MNLKDKILAFMRHEAYKPLTAEDLAKEMQFKGKKLVQMFETLAELDKEAQIIKTSKGKYGIPARMNCIVGRLEVSRKGFGFIISDNSEEADVYVAAGNFNGAMNGDRAIVRITQIKAGFGKSYEGEVIRVIIRANKQIVGIYVASPKFGFLIPDDRRISTDIFIALEDAGNAQNGQKVVAEIIKWPELTQSAVGKIVEILGNKGDPGIEIAATLVKHNLSRKFPEDVEQAAEAVPGNVMPSDLVGRRDLRELTIVTIDGEDAKDLDDAVNVKQLDNGNYLLGVHIADVSYYVQEASALDDEARERATSVYLVDRVIPMLPPRLSNVICSLNAGEDRLALSADMEIDSRGKVVDYSIFPSVINVKKRLTYTIVRQILTEEDKTPFNEYSALFENLEDMQKLCKILRKRRLIRGAIDFDFPEIKVKLDDEGRPIAIVKRLRTIAESIIEEFMLVANETIAEHMSKRKVPFIYRVHEEPEPEKMAKLSKLINNFGYSAKLQGTIEPKVLQKVLESFSGKPEEKLISTVMLRSLKQARYEANNLGHFGLAAKYYTHFTSPIRRYPDLIAHRLVRQTFTEESKASKSKPKLAERLSEIAIHCSIKERAATDAERETVDLKKVEYMAGFVGQEFDGIISGVTSFGLFVELKNSIEGLIHVSNMDDDFYNYVEEQYALIGERLRNVFRLGDSIKIILVKANIEERMLDFALSNNHKRENSISPKKNKKQTDKENVSKESVKSKNKYKKRNKGETNKLKKKDSKLILLKLNSRT